MLKLGQISSVVSIVLLGASAVMLGKGVAEAAVPAFVCAGRV
jgi:hypothetical protein